MADLGADKNAAYITTYSPSFLTHFYDKYVLGFNMTFMWGCSVDKILLPFFSENFSRNHLDIGVATGYFPATALARPFRRDSKHRLTLVDLGPNPLRAASARVRSVTSATDVRCVEADATEAPPEELRCRPRFDSISMFNLFHCVPGGKGKFRAFGLYKDLLSEDGVLTGCTVLGNAHATNWLTSLYLRYYNRRLRVFHNWDDREEDVREALENEFEEVETWVIGMVMLFRAKRPKKPLVDVQ